MSFDGRAAFFAFVGVAVFSHWLVTDPTHDVSALQTNWWYVLAFSAVIAVIGPGILVLAQRLPGAAHAGRRSPLPPVQALRAPRTSSRTGSQWVGRSSPR